MNNLIQELGGNSGETLKVHFERGVLCVEKYFYTDLQRAKKNIGKQLSFQPVLHGRSSLTACPGEICENQDHYILRMPYIDGAVAEEMALTATPTKAKNLKKLLSKHLNESICSAQIEEFNYELFKHKIHNVQQSSDNSFESFFSICSDLIKRADLLDMSGPCHGDLTLANVICESENTFYLIDFLHTFKDSPLQDLAKISQDRRFGWSLRRRNAATRNRGMIFFRLALPDVADYVDEKMRSTFEIYELLNLLRIAPYVKDETTFRWLHEALSKQTRELSR